MTIAPPFTRALLTSKLNPPSAHLAQVPRKAVCDLVCADSGARLALVRAPAGFGKTTAMAQCVARFEEQGVASAWLTLDDADNDVARFLACTEAAVCDISGEDVRPASGHGGEARLSPGEAALTIVSRLTEQRVPFALFLDDFERIQDRAVVSLVREIIEHLPTRGRLVIGTRTLPDLGLGRLRARGQLLEVDTERLRFSLDETFDFLVDRRQIPLSQDDLSRIHRKTEGWGAALWLASLALDRQDNPGDFVDRFSGAHQPLADYLAEDVLLRQPPHMQDFLLRTSILRHLSPPLCDALVPGIDSHRVLQELEASNLFLVPLAGEDRTYRYHSLFADFLRGRLSRDRPDEVPELHRDAANWYEEQGRPVPAIDHALEGAAYTQAIRLLCRHARDLLVQGRMRLLTRWLDSMPDAHLLDHPSLRVIHVWALCFTRGPQEAYEVLEATGLEQSTDPLIQANVAAIRPQLLGIMDCFEDAHAAGLSALERLPGPDPFADSALVNAMANAFSVLGQEEQARSLLDRARHADGGRDNGFNVMYSECIDGIIDLRAGRLRQAGARFRLGLAASRRTSSLGYSSGNAWAGVLHAGTAYEANELEQAARLLHVYVPLARDVGLPDHMILGDVMLVRIAFAEGDVDRAFGILVGLEHAGHVRGLPRVVASARLERSRLLLLQNRAEAARTELHRADDREVWERVNRLHLLANDLEYFALARLRWEALAGNPRAASHELETELAAASAEGRYRRALKLRLLLAVASNRCGETAYATKLMRAILREAAAEGYQRLILDEGPEAGQLVIRLRDDDQQGAGRSDPIVAEAMQRLLDGFGADVTEAAPAGEVPINLVEPLTRKEIHTLQLLADGYSNSAMAEKMFVSDSTVRTHLRNINAKLGAESRTQAVAIARRLAVI